MDADAYLRKQGWKGAGHSLDHYGRGIKKPLLIAHKQDQLGLGKKKAAHSVDDQWWMRAFDESLQNIGTGQETTLSQVRAKGINRGGLYGFFVRGEGLAGTVSNTEESSAVEASNSSAPSSGASTPPTSTPESDSGSSPQSSEDDMSVADTEDTAKKSNKRKRSNEDGGKSHKKLKQDAEGAVKHSNTLFGTLDLDQMTKVTLVMQDISRRTKATIDTNAKNGVYGLYTPSKEVEGRKKGEAHQACDDPNNSGKTITYKTAKIQREKAMREAKKDVTKEYVVAAMLKGELPNPKRWTKDKALANYGRIDDALSSIKKTEKEIRKGAKEQQKLAKQTAATEQRCPDKEQREAQKCARETAELTKQRQAAQSKLVALTVEKKAEYEERAAEKDQTLEEYILRRMEKKDEKRAARQVEREAKKQLDAAPDVAFFTDLDGDSRLLDDGLRAAAALELPKYEPLSDGSCPLDPSIWEGRVVKTLPKPVRKARRQYLENQRNERKVRAGKPLVQGPSRAEKKHKHIEFIMKDILSKQGVDKGATKEQKDLARKAARKILKAEKPEVKMWEDRKKRKQKLMQTKKGKQRVGERAKARKEAVKAAAARLNAAVAAAA